MEALFGTGYLLMQYAENFETCGIDYNQKMVEIAQKNCKKKGVPVNLQPGNVENLPFEDGYFNTIVNTMAFTGYPDGNKALAEFHRVLTKTGRF